MGMITPEIRQRLGLAPGRPYFDGFNPEDFPVPAFVVDRAALDYNLGILKGIGEASGGRVLAALKAFSLPACLGQIARQLEGASTSGLYESRLAREQGFRSIHVYAPAYSDQDLSELFELADTIIFNSLKQWARIQALALKARDQQALTREQAGRPELSFGIRINPEHREGWNEIYDASAPRSRMGTTRAVWEGACQKHGLEQVLEGLSGLHFHNLCEQGLEPLKRTLESISKAWGEILDRPEIRWLNLGGGHHITKPAYDRAGLIELIKKTAGAWKLEILLEPGEAVAIQSGILTSRILERHENQGPLAILDVSATCHLPDVLEVPYTPEIWEAPIANPARSSSLRLAGPTCLTGDVIGDYEFDRLPERGEIIVFDDMAHYTTVKTTYFNGIPHPALVVWDSRTKSGEVVREFGYQDFISKLS